MENGIVGIKPTMGLVGRSGIIPISSTFDTAGPMVRTVRDAAVLLSVIAQPDPDDAATQVREYEPVDYTKFLDKNGLEGVKIGIVKAKPSDDSNMAEEKRAALDSLYKAVSDAGAVLVDDIELDFEAKAWVIMHNEFKACLNYYLSTLNGSSSMKTLQDIVEYNQSNAAVALKYGQGRLLQSQNAASGTFTETSYIEAIKRRDEAIKWLDKVFDDRGVDIMLCETFAGIAPYTGFPSMTIPIGQRHDNVPIGSYWIARRFDEAMLFKVTYAVEQMLGLTLRPDLIKHHT